MKILFMGTPDFALASLRALCEAGEDVIGVVTQPDQPKGRGYALTPPPVKVYAQERGLPVFQPATLRDDAFYDLLLSLAPDLIVVAAYGKLLPQRVLDFPPFGCVNVHGSLLPAYRGAAPIQRAIMDGQTMTGITTMRMNAGLDTGDILLTGEVPIRENDNFEAVHDRMANCGAAVLLRTIAGLREGTITPQRQDDSRATYAPKIEKSDCVLDFSDSARCLHNQIRGLSPFPLAFTRTPDGRLLKVLASEVAEEGDAKTAPPSAAAMGKAACAQPGDSGLPLPGTVLSLEDGKVTVACGKGKLALLAVLPEGKGRMPASAWINGRKIRVGDCLGQC